VTPIWIAAAAAALVILIVVVLALVLSARARARRARLRALPSHVPLSPTVIVCPFCRREYDPPDTGGRCPGCGAAAPRKR
jgi:hypothetical protein